MKEKPVSSSQAKSKSNSNSKAKPLPASCSALSQLYMVVDATLPSHIIHNRSLFATYMPGCKVHRTAFGHNIIIEGTRDAHIQVFVAGKYICFQLRNCWHVPSSPHHFLSCSTVVSIGHQVMIAGRSPRLIYSHKHHLEEPNLPKYMLFTRVDGLIVLTFEIPAQNFIPPQPASTTTPST